MLRAGQVKTRMSVRRAVLVVVGAAALAGCKSPLDSGEERYTLATVNGKALPFSSDRIIETTSGSLVLHPDGRLTHSAVIRCKTNLAPGSCEVYNNGQIHNEGTYSRAEGWVRFGRAQFPATFGSNEVTITVGCTPSQGPCAPQVDAYRR